MPENYIYLFESSFWESFFQSFLSKNALKAKKTVYFLSPNNSLQKAARRNFLDLPPVLSAQETCKTGHEERPLKSLMTEELMTYKTERKQHKCHAAKRKRFARMKVW